MAKTTRHGGPTYEFAEIPIVRYQLGGTSLVGNNSLSSQKPTKSIDELNKHNPLPVAQTTENPSLVSTEGQADTAPTTVGNGQKAARRPSTKRRPATIKDVELPKDDWADFE